MDIPNFTHACSKNLEKNGQKKLLQGYSIREGCSVGSLQKFARRLHQILLPSREIVNASP
jgi:hypothetical protein